jgi:hypothetical protein
MREFLTSRATGGFKRSMLLPVVRYCNKLCLTLPYVPIPMVMQSKAWVYGHLLAGIVGLNPPEGMDVFHL